MKYNVTRTLLLLQLFVSSFLAAQENPQWQNPRPFGYDFFDIRFVDEQNGWASANHIMKSRDGGKHWTSCKTPPFGFPGVGLYPLDMKTCIVYGIGGIVKTTDGGETWGKKSGTAEDMFFISPTKGWAVGERGNILTTTDAGESWYPQNNTTSVNLNSIWFTDQKTGFIVGENGILLWTSNGGREWRSEVLSKRILDCKNCYRFKDNLRKIEFLNKSEGWIDGRYKTTDGGRRWKIVEGDERKLAPMNMREPQISIEKIIDGNGEIIWDRSNDSLLNYRNPVPYGFGFRRIFTLHHKIWGAGSWGNIGSSSDTGKTWHMISSGNKHTIKSNHFFDSKTGFTFLGEEYDDTVGCDNNAAILRTTNGGNSWHEMKIQSRFGLSAGLFVNRKTGWAADKVGGLFKTVDGGETWAIHKTGFQGNDDSFIGGLTFTDPLNGWMSTNRYFLRTWDGGKTWKDLTPDKQLPGNFLKLKFINQKIGFGVERMLTNAFRMTTDGGINWETIENNSLDFFFLNKQLGWQVGDKGITRTTDGGITWETLTSFTSPETKLICICFSNPFDGYAISDYGRFYATTDGGRHWNERKDLNINLYSFDFHYSIASPDPQNVWILGDGGSILHFDICE